MESAIIVFSKSPYGHINAIEGARIGQGLYVLDLPSAAVFMDDGVFALIKDQKPEGIMMHPVRGTLEGLKNLDVEFYAIKESMEERGISEDMLDDYAEAKIITLEEFVDLQEKYDTTIFF
ncbi:MAG: DsrE family protein [Candidatus Odinarchaeia archaeon]